MLKADDATSVDYQVVVDGSKAILDEASGVIPASDSESSLDRVTDLERDRHRMSCSDATSQYVDTRRMTFVPTVDVADAIEAIRDHFVAKDWALRRPIAEDLGKEVDRDNGRYSQVLTGPDGYGLTIARDLDADSGIKLDVFSPCVANPTDKLKNWGMFQQ